MRRILGMHDRLTRSLWSAGWTIPLGAFVLLLSIPFWQAVTIDAEQAAMQQIDYEDATLCAKFGFVAGSDKYASCMLDLFDLRRSHASLMVNTSLP
jgi:hypothetical protein